MSELKTPGGDFAPSTRREFLQLGAKTAAMLAVFKVGAARAQGQSYWEARPPKSGVGPPLSIDLHSHWEPESYIKALGELGHPVTNPFPLNFDLDKRRQWMDEHGVKMNVLTLNGQMTSEWKEGGVDAHLAQIINDAGIEAHAAFPDRFVLGVEMPIRNPQAALKELNRVAGKPGVNAVHLPDEIDNRNYVFEPEFAPVLARIEELGYPIVFHHMSGEDNRFGRRPVSAGLDEAFEHTVLASKFITSGTLDKYPKLEIVLPHAGGAFPFLAGRVEHFLYHMPNHEQVSLEHPFKDYVRRFHYDYLIYYPEAFTFLMNLVGSDRIVVGTDNFAAKDILYPNDVLDQFNLSADDRDRILRGNATRLLHL